MTARPSVSVLTRAPVHTSQHAKPVGLAGVVTTSTCAAPLSLSRFAIAPRGGSTPDARESESVGV
jgi:hypothetical protein